MEEDVRRLYEPFAQGDLEALLDRVTEDVEWLSPPGGVPGLDPVYRGKEGVRRWFVDLREGWDLMEVRAEHVEEVEPGLALVTARMHGLAAGAETEMALWHVIRFEGGRVAFLQPFFESSAALAAAQDLKTDRPR